jgi:SPOR domain
MAIYLRISAALFAAALGLSVIAPSARADDATAALTQASKMIEQGIPVKAIELIDAALSSGKLPADASAKALLMRGQAQEKLNKLAFALADYNSALWMGGLSPADKAKAEDGRDRIGSKLGIASESGKAAPEPAEHPDPGKEKKPRVPKASASEQPTGSSLSSVFSSIFGSSETSSQETQRPTPVAATVTVAPERPRVTSVKAEKPARSAAAKPAASPAASSDEPGGKFGIQFAALRSEDGAISEVDRIAKKFGPELAGRSPAVKILATDDGGTLYKIVAEPYDRGEATAICELLKTKNLSCMIISR